MESKAEDFHPTLMFGFMLDAKGKEVLCQLWVNSYGLADYRPVPMIELGKERKPAIAGYLEGDDDGEND